MSKATSTLIVLILLTTLCIIISASASPNSWTTKAPMQQTRSVLGVAAVNGKIYAIGGSTASGWAPSIPPPAAYGDINLNAFVGTNEEYDPTLNTWTYKASMPTPRMAFATAVYLNKIYCIGGRNRAGDLEGGYTAINEVYDPVTDTWEIKSSMPAPAGWLTANTVGNKIYVIDPAGTNYVYDTVADAWSTKAPVPAVAFDGYASAVIDGKIHVIGGLSADQRGNLHFVYDPETDTWASALPPPSSQGGGAAGATIGALAPKRVYVFGEIANLRQGENTDFVRIYDPKKDSWEYGADSPTNRYNFGVVNLNETFYVIGGHTYEFPGSFAPSNVNEQYTPVGYGTPDPSYDNVPPEIIIESPKNETYYTLEVPLDFVVNEPVTQISYILDSQNSVVIVGNLTLQDLTYGTHQITLSAIDIAGNVSSSKTTTFTLTEPLFPRILLISVFLVTIVVILIVVFLRYLMKKRKEIHQGIPHKQRSL